MATVGTLPYTPGATINAVPMLEDWQLNLGKQVGGFLANNATGYTPGALYTGPRVAGMSAPEQTGINKLNQALNINTPGPLFAQGKGEVSNILSGAYTNPETSPYIQAMQAIMDRNLQGQIDKSRLGAGARGSFYGTKAMEEETGLRQKSLEDRGLQIADMINKERDRMTAMVPEAKAYANYENVEFPMAQVGASQQYGALPRAVEQADMESQYQDWTRGRGELATTTGQALAASKSGPDYGLKSITMPNTLDTSQMTPEAIAKMFAGNEAVPAGGSGGGGGGGGASPTGGYASNGITGVPLTGFADLFNRNLAQPAGSGQPTAAGTTGVSGGTSRGGTPIAWDKSSLIQPNAGGATGTGTPGAGVPAASAATPGAVDTPIGQMTPQGGPGQMSYAEGKTFFSSRYPNFSWAVNERGVFGAPKGSGATSGMVSENWRPLTELLQSGALK
jgi:hypothetical protein